ncbi:RHS repeat-associated core domain-containing protein [Streptomyces sp. 1114.5]|uniref:RHS repeat-associated core domain-containing protein n=1 Tax=Streptomyces sp. 1114.5 TaxID=1938830 RepID=UPI00217E28C8|nr:RHS repeat-associated core domain-containing protein [Streptomyces sp. 1114.5]
MTGVAVPPAAAWTFPKPDEKVWTPPNGPHGGDTVPVKGHDLATPARQSAPQPPSKPSKIAKPLVTGTETVTVGADGAEAKAARSATGGASPASGGDSGATAGALAVRVAPGTGAGESAHKVTVQVTAQEKSKAAGVTTPVVALSDAEAPSDKGNRTARVTLDLNALQAADWSDRAVLVALPACGLTTPERPECRTKTPVPSKLDGDGQITADVVLPATTVRATTANQNGTVKAGFTADRASAGAADAAQSQALLLGADPAPNGPLGNYSATPLSPSAAWGSGTNVGNFTYTYPIQVPPPLGGAAPAVGLSYNSAAVDGKTSATNSQPSWIGDGWGYEPGFIERSYRGCDKAGIPGSADQCWGGQNATVSFGGHSGTIVRGDKDGVWHLQDDDGSTVEQLTGAPKSAGDTDYRDMEYWRITTPDGIQYYFGRNHLPGGDGSDPAANSVLTTPVYSPNSGDPCFNSATGNGSWCQMAWRWQLDYVVDTRGNLTTYKYATEGNKYGRGRGQSGNTGGTATDYQRAGYIKEIGYGQRLDDQKAAKGVLKPAAKILFQEEERCDPSLTPSCSADQRATHPTAWPDVPVDQICDSSSCATSAPTFFTTKRLSQIATQVLVNSDYRTVDTWKLNQTLADPGDMTGRLLQLDSVQRIPSNGQAEITNLPAVTFKYEFKDNRVDGNKLTGLRYKRPRLTGLTTETGGRTNVIYGDVECSRDNNHMPVSEDRNTMACMPVKWYLPGQSSPDPVDDWFNKYLVRTVTEQDTTGASPLAKTTEYTYDAAGAAWHRNDAEFTDPKTRTWDQFRGYQSVTVTTGSEFTGEAPKTQQKVTYLRGMDGDYLADKSRRGVQVANPLGGTVTDSDWRSGQVLATEVFDKAGGTVQTVSGSTPTPDPDAQQISSTHAQSAGAPNIYARYADSRTTALSTARLADGGSRTTTVVTTTEPARGNRVITVDDKGDGTAATPETCTTTRYADSDNKQLLNLVAERVTIQGPCGSSPAAANTVSGTRTLYDGKAFGKAGTVGDPTTGQVLDHFDQGGNPVYVHGGSSTFDAYGRSLATSTTDGSTYGGDGTQLTGPSVTPAVTTSALSPASGALPTEVRTTGPMGAAWTTSVTQDPARGSPLTSKDINGRVTTAQYDALGRITAVWAPDRPTGGEPSKRFSYFLNSDKPSAVKTESLNDDGGTYSATIDILDGLGRPRQTQSTSAARPVGRLITDTVYDSHGWVVKTNAPYYEASSFPSQSVFVASPAGAVQDGQIPSQTATSYDGMGRAVRSDFRSYGNVQWSTTTAYPGADRTDVTPPAGSTPTSTVTDARGRTTAAWQYRTATATGNPADADVTTYGYTPGGLASRRTDSSGNSWTYEYDLRGRQVSASDPDTGVTRTSFDVNSRIDHTTDANGSTLAYSYDLLGRKTGLYNGSVAPANQLAAWTYDTLVNGQLTSSTRYVGGAGGAAYVKAVTGYDTMYRPLGTSVTIPKSDPTRPGTVPAAEDPLGTTYTTTNTYRPVIGALEQIDIPAAGGLPAESVGYQYTITGLITYVGSSLKTAITAQVNYDAYARPVSTTVGHYGQQVVSRQQYDGATGRVINSFIDRQTGTTALDQTSYTYTPSGRITSVTNLQNATARDTQCFTYDYLGRLTRAWTDTGGTHTTADWTDSNGTQQGTGSSDKVPGIGGCDNATGPASTGPGTDTFGGPSPYWQDYTYDATGNRTGLTQHGSASPTALDTTRITQVASAADSTRTWSVALANGALWLGSQAKDGSTSPYTDLMAQAGALPTVTAVSAAVSNGQLQVMAVAGGKVWHTVRQDDGSWQKWGDVFSVVGVLPDPSQLALTATASGLEVLTFSGGKLWHTVRRPDGTWQAQGWGDVYSVVGPLSSATQIAASATASGLEIAVGAGGKLWHTVRRPDGTWQEQGWGDVYSVTGVLSGAQTGQGQLTLANTDDGLQVVALAQGKPWHVVRNSAGSWSQWADVTGVAGQIAPLTTVGAAGAGVGLNVTVAGAGKLSETTRDGTTGKWAAWSTVATGNGTGSSTTQAFRPMGSTNTPTAAPNTGGGTGGPHALLSSTTTTPTGSKAVSYQYDAKGRTTAITDTGGTATLAWNGEDKLASYARTGQAGATTYLYDADGNPLIRRSPGKTTLFLPTDELTLDTATGSMSNVRSISAGGGLTFTRVTAPIGGGTVLIQAADPHGTNSVQINTDAAQTVTRRDTDPFGNLRGTQPTAGQWAGTKGFVGGTKDDTTGLTNLGARQYDPTTGRFINPDPILDAANPQQWNGYAYSNNNPVNLSDPSGLHPEGVCGGFGTCESPQHDIIHEAWHPNDTGGWNVDYWDNVLSDSKHPLHAGNDWSLITRGKKTKWQRFLEGVDLAVSLTPVGAVTDAAKDVYHGDYASAALNLAGLIPGERLVGKAAQLAGKAGKAEKAVQEAESAITEACALAGATHSFPSGTRVLLANGTTQAIEDLQVGDQVQATDPVTGDTQPKAVIRTIRTPDDEHFTDLTLQANDPGYASQQAENLTSTQHHPFWDETTRRWTNASELHPGDEVRTADGRTLTVLTVWNYDTAPQTAYDLTVADLHTYYVLAGTTPVLVHNCGKWTGQGEHPLEDFVANAIEDAHPDLVKGMGRKTLREDGTTWSDHDVYGDDFVIEVASGKGSGKTAQIRDRVLPTAGGARVAVYGPKMGGHVARGIEELGVPVFRRMEDLVAWAAGG